MGSGLKNWTDTQTNTYMDLHIDDGVFVIGGVSGHYWKLFRDGKTVLFKTNKHSI